MPARRAVQGAAFAGAETKALRAGFDQQFNALEAALDALSDRIEATAAGNVDTLHERFSDSRQQLTLALGLAAGGMLAAWGAWFTRQLWRRLRAEPTDLARLSQRIAQGDLGAPTAANAPAGSVALASEVRMLAQRSAGAAREIKSLIGANVARVDQGNDQVGEAGRTMDEIIAAIGRLGQVAGEIAAASGSQRDDLREAGQAVTQLDDHTQQNAALVEQRAAAAESLRQQAEQLLQAVSGFRLQAEALA